MSYLRSNITAYNNGLETRLATFQSSNSGVTGTLFNTTDSFTTVLDSPSTYGATDSTCMNSDGTSCVWYDNYHPGQAIHKLVAQGFVETLTGSLF
jgi:phospholipase/lecithinase/hemolysin